MAEFDIQEEVDAVIEYEEMCVRMDLFLDHLEMLQDELLAMTELGDELINKINGKITDVGDMLQTASDRLGKEADACYRRILGEKE